MKKLTSLAFFCYLAATLVACNLPTTSGIFPVVGKSATPSDPLPTQVPPPRPSPIIPTAQPTGATPTAPATFTPPPSSVTSPEPSIVPSSTPVCDRASPGNPIDISIPDNSPLQPGQSFTKTWRLLNTGSCTWTTDYAAVWFSGQTLGAPITINLTNPVASGKSIDISVDMVAPDQPGAYQSNWKLANRAGKLFGIGPTGDAPFWVRIVVSQPQGSLAETSPVQQSLTPTPGVYATGLANLTFNDGLNLDQIQINQGTADDLVYLQKDNQHQIVPENGAQLGQVGKGQPSMADCQTASLNTDPQILDGLSPGVYFCYKTNLGLPGWARLMYLNPNDQVLTVEILTWSTP